MFSVCGSCVVLPRTCLNSQRTDADSVYCLPDTAQIASAQTDEGQLDFYSGCFATVAIFAHFHPHRLSGERQRCQVPIAVHLLCKVPQTHRFANEAAICGICDLEFCSGALYQNWAWNHRSSVSGRLQLSKPGRNVLKEAKHKTLLNCT